MRIHKILCPIDFSAGSQAAMHLATRLATESDAELVLVHAWYVPPLAFAGDYMLPPTVLQEMSDDVQRGLDDAVKEVTKWGATRVSAKLLSGIPWTAIVGELDDPTYELVVIGTHGRSGLSRILLGSVAEKVVRHAPCSVLAVRPDGEAKAFTNILCPIDFNGCSRVAMELAASIVTPGGEGITLLHVIDVPVGYSSEPAIAGLVRDLDKYAAILLDKWAATLRPLTTEPIMTRSRIGHPGAQTLAVLEEDPTFDLVVVGSHGRTGISRVLLGSVAEKIVRHASCPVLVARKRT
jgi:nucleotide-binding universal stress UspA family protein